MISIAPSADPKIALAGLATNFKAFNNFKLHVKKALHIEAFKVYTLMLENRVREFRVKKKLTQTQLAEATEVSRQTIHSIENNNAIPTVEIAIKIATTMKTKVENLFFITRKRT